ncbi:MAG: hypothetical protein WCH11_00510 [Bdellovibrio sp.]
MSNSFQLENLPRWFTVSSVLVGGILLIFALKKPHSICKTQMEAFQESQRGNLYPKKVGKTTVPGLLNRTQEACQLGASAGACFEFFAVLRRTLKDLRNFPDHCGSEILKQPEIHKALSQGVELMVRFAWGESPPKDVASKFSWLESTDLALFCAIRDQWVRLEGKDSWDQLREFISTKLPSEPPRFESGVCSNCQSRPPALTKLGREEVWRLSIFSIRCDQYR